MNLSTIRRIYRWMIVPGIGIAALLLWDAFGNDGRLFGGLTLLALAYLALLLIFLLLPADDRDSAHIEPPEMEPMSAHYPPTETRP